MHLKAQVNDAQCLTSWLFEKYILVETNFIKWMHMKPFTNYTVFFGCVI